MSPVPYTYEGVGGVCLECRPPCQVCGSQLHYTSGCRTRCGICGSVYHDTEDHEEDSDPGDHGEDAAAKSRPSGRSGEPPKASAVQDGEGRGSPRGGASGYPGVDEVGAMEGEKMRTYGSGSEDSRTPSERSDGGTTHEGSRRRKPCGPCQGCGRDDQHGWPGSYSAGAAGRRSAEVDMCRPFLTWPSEPPTWPPNAGPEPPPRGRRAIDCATTAAGLVESAAAATNRDT